MKVVIQRVENASVKVEDQTVGEIGKGLLVLVGFEKDDQEDTEKKIKFISEKIVNLRIFEDSHGKMNLSVKDIKGSLLVISNFTLAGSVKKGRRPSFDNTLSGEKARDFYNKFVNFLKKINIPVREVKCDAHMKIELINDGPVTFIFEK